MAEIEKQSEVTGNNTCIYNRELFLLIAANEAEISSRDMQRMNAFCRRNPTPTVDSVCREIGWKPEASLRNALLIHCCFQYTPPYSPLADIEELCDADLMYQIRQDRFASYYQITPAGEERAEEIRARLMKARKKREREVQKNLPKFWRGETVFTAQPDLSTRCKTIGFELIVRPAEPRPLSLLGKILSRLPSWPTF